MKFYHTQICKEKLKKPCNYLPKRINYVLKFFKFVSINMHEPFKFSLTKLNAYRTKIRISMSLATRYTRNECMVRHSRVSFAMTTYTELSNMGPKNFPYLFHFSDNNKNIYTFSEKLICWVFPFPKLFG